MFKKMIRRLVRNELKIFNPSRRKISISENDLYNIITDWTVYNYRKKELSDFVEEVFNEWEIDD